MQEEEAVQCTWRNKVQTCPLQAARSQTTDVGMDRAERAGAEVRSFSRYKADEA